MHHRTRALCRAGLDVLEEVFVISVERNVVEIIATEVDDVYLKRSS